MSRSTLSPVAAETTLDAARKHVDAAFHGFIGNDEAVYTLKRSLIVALGSAAAGAAPVISVNGTWKIAVPTQYAKEWWDTRLMTTLKRIMHGIVGQPCEPEFVVIRRGEA